MSFFFFLFYLFSQLQHTFDAALAPNPEVSFQIDKEISFFSKISLFSSLFFQRVELLIEAFIYCQSESHAWTYYHAYRSNTSLTNPPTSPFSSPSPSPKTTTNEKNTNISWKPLKAKTYISLCDLLWQNELDNHNFLIFILLTHLFIVINN